MANPWIDRWKEIVQLQGKQFNLPGGALGRRYVDTVTKEVLYLSTGNFPAERLIVFCAVTLQRDRLIKR